MPASRAAAPRRRLFALFPAALIVLAVAPAPAAPPSAAASAELGRIRAAVPCGGGPTEDAAQALTHKGRAAVAITGRELVAGQRGPIRDFAVFDEGAGRIVSHVCFPHASTRKAGEPIVSLATISTAADARAAAVLPGAALGLESIQRYRLSGEQSVYYEARYAATQDEVPFLEPPVRLLLNASTGTLFRLDVDPDWLDRGPTPRLLISRKAAERIAAVVLRSADLATRFGAGASPGKVGPADLFMVRANAALAPATAGGDERARPAWVVPFRLEGVGAEARALFVDAATGRAIGGTFSGEAAVPVMPPPAPTGPGDVR